MIFLEGLELGIRGGFEIVGCLVLLFNLRYNFGGNFLVIYFIVRMKGLS